MASFFVLGFVVAAVPSWAACAKPKNQATATTPHSAIRVVPGGNNYSVAAGTATALTKAINQWNAVCGDDVPTLSKTATSGIELSVNYFKGSYNLGDSVIACAG